MSTELIFILTIAIIVGVLIYLSNKESSKEKPEDFKFPKSIGESKDEAERVRKETKRKLGEFRTKKPKLVMGKTTHSNNIDVDSDPDGDIIDVMAGAIILNEMVNGHTDEFESPNYDSSNYDTPSSYDSNSYDSSSDDTYSSSDSSSDSDY